ncbi:unnamed protein product, partial [Nesidiocoris tenuis]
MEDESSGNGGFGDGFGGASGSVAPVEGVFSGNSDDGESAMSMDDTVAGLLLDWIQRYYTPALVGFGTIGNCLSVVVFFFSTKLRKLSSSYYLSALAISDTGYLFCTFFSWLNMVNIDIFNRPGFCEFSVYLTQGLACGISNNKIDSLFSMNYDTERRHLYGYKLSDIVLMVRHQPMLSDTVGFCPIRSGIVLNGQQILHDA